MKRYLLLTLSFACITATASAQKKKKKPDPKKTVVAEPPKPALPSPVEFVQKDIAVSKEKEKPKKIRSLVIGSPMDCGIDSMRLFPVGMTFQPTLEQQRAEMTQGMTNMNINSLGFSTNSGPTNFDVHAKVEYISNSSVPWTLSRRGNTVVENTCDISNILFYNIVTGETYPLMKDTVHILSFAFHNEFETPKIFYRVVKNDVNGDSLYTNEDDVMLYASDLNGKNLVQLTPDNQQFADYTFFEKQNKILFKTRINANQDKRFTNDDETNFYEVNMKMMAMGRPIFSQSLRDSLRVN